MEGQTNGLCIAGFIVSLGSLFLGLFGITGLVGVTLSAVGRSQAANNGGKTGLGTAGIYRRGVLLGHVGDCRRKGLTKNHHNKKALEPQSSNAFLLFGVTIYFLTSSSPSAFTSTVTFWPGRTSPAMMALASMVSRWLCI